MTKQDACDQLMDFISASPSPYHAVDWLARYLEGSGFTEVEEKNSWEPTGPKKCFMRTGGKSMIAWIQGAEAPTSSGFRIVGAHTDSPCLKPRRTSLKTEFGISKLETSIYGSPIYQTWLDRDLGVAGCLFTKSDQNEVLYRSSKPVLRTSSVAIHLDKGPREEGMRVNPHQHLDCLVASETNEKFLDLADLIAHEIGVEGAEILSSDLYLFDFQEPTQIGGKQGLISSARLDNLFSCFCATYSLANQEEPIGSTSVVALFDAEEIGSRSWLGAQSSMMSQTLNRISKLHTPPGAKEPIEDYRQAIANSYLFSIDMAHANHPNYASKLQHDNAPNLNGGVAIKKSNRGHYAISVRLEGLLRLGAEAKKIPVQDFMYREDLGGGTSIGPLLAAQLGVEAVDIGVGLLGMHSIRELVGACDVKHCIDFLDMAFSV